MHIILITSKCKVSFHFECKKSFFRHSFGKTITMILERLNFIAEAQRMGNWAQF